MANTTRIGANWLQIILDGTGDWISPTAEHWTKAYLGSVTTTPLTVGDSVVFAEVVPSIASSEDYPRKRLTSRDGYETEMKLSGTKCKIMIDYSQCSFGTVGNALITLEMA